MLSRGPTEAMNDRESQENQEAMNDRESQENQC